MNKVMCLTCKNMFNRNQLNSKFCSRPCYYSFKKEKKQTESIEKKTRNRRTLFLRSFLFIVCLYFLISIFFMIKSVYCVEKDFNSDVELYFESCNDLNYANNNIR